MRFVLVLAAEDDDQILAETERLTDAYWRGTARGAPALARALHLLGQMVARRAMTSHAGKEHGMPPALLLLVNNHGSQVPQLLPDPADKRCPWK
ncbi:hypothetical protein [Streptomyces sp. NPDC058394]|uniref:hypothetical protein n=1 Tax=unclassified Streptomyces TaxID=2593676 RepID=UPI00365F24A9